MDIIIPVIWPGLISAAIHIFALINAIDAVRQGGKVAAKIAVVVCFIAIPLALAIPIFAFAVAFGYDYSCSSETLGMNTCLLLRWLPIPALLITNIITWRAAGFGVRSIPTGNNSKRNFRS